MLVIVSYVVHFVVAFVVANLLTTLLMAWLPFLAAYALSIVAAYWITMIVVASLNFTVGLIADWICQRETL